MTVKIGVIGTGAIGRDHARRINEVLGGAKVVALSDVNRALAEAVKKTSPLMPPFSPPARSSSHQLMWMPCL